jgi:hypothetical protein
MEDVDKFIEALKKRIVSLFVKVPVQITSSSLLVALRISSSITYNFMWSRHGTHDNHDKFINYSPWQGQQFLSPST